MAFVIPLPAMITMLLFSLGVARASATGDVDLRRAFLGDLAFEIDGSPGGPPVRRLVQREDSEGELTSARKIELVEMALALEADLAAELRQSRATVRAALDVLLDHDRLIEQVFAGAHAAAAAYSQTFHAAALEKLRTRRVGLWLSLMREARHFDGKRAVLRAAGMVDLARLGDPRYLGFEDARWHLRLVTPAELREFAAFHVAKIVSLKAARAALEGLPPSDLARKTRFGVDVVLDLLRRQLHELPEIVGAKRASTGHNRRRAQQEQPQTRPMAAWVRLGEVDPPEPGRDAWELRLRALAREMHVSESDIFPVGCEGNALN